MPYKLDETDIALLKSLFRDARKSFRQISREIKVSTPTVKARYQRLVNVGLIRGVYPNLDLGRLESRACQELDAARQQSNKAQSIKLGKNIIIKLGCDYCKGPVSGKPMILRFGQFERFFCCKSCRMLYKEKYRTKISTM